MYDTSAFSTDSAEEFSALQDELYTVLLTGPGVFVLKNMYTDHAAIDTANTAFARIITRERSASTAKGDHFAAGGRNDRIWITFSKHCLEDPASFVSYYSNPWFRIVSEAWLGPAYRITAQTNIVKPGGAAQVAHRDYHLGFQTEHDCARFPRAMQIASQLLTLQGAVAHTDMPVESGPTRLLPFSQAFEEGYMAYRLPDFTQYFLENYISLPLSKGDGLFFNPALFHAAGENTTADFHRSANLIQVSSAFGKTMETVDTVPLIEACWQELVLLRDTHGLESRKLGDCIAAIAEGYPFPTNLDRRPPAPSGMAPGSEQGLLRRGLSETWSKEEMITALRRMIVESQA